MIGLWYHSEKGFHEHGNESSRYYSLLKHYAVALYITRFNIWEFYVPSQLVSLEFFIDIKFFRSHYGHGVDSASNGNKYQEHFLGVKASAA